MRKLSMLPAVCFGLIVLYACYSTAIVGHWPHYAHPDPKQLPGRWLVNVAGILSLVGILSVIGIPAGYSVYRGVAAWRSTPIRPHLGPIIAYFAGAALWLLDIAAEFAELPWSSLAGWVLD